LAAQRLSYSPSLSAITLPPGPLLQPILPSSLCFYLVAAIVLPLDSVIVIFVSVRLFRPTGISTNAPRESWQEFQQVDGKLTAISFCKSYAKKKILDNTIDNDTNGLA
jgi:hypothetical protein